jgi:hypothetical protein
MWPRVVEAMLGCWLAVSPFVFRHPGDRPVLWGTDWVAAALILGLALLSCVRQTRRAHLLELLVAGWLIGFGWATSSGLAEPAKQNWILVGLLVLMLAALPTDCDRPPLKWQEWNERHPSPPA